MLGFGKAVVKRGHMTGMLQTAVNAAWVLRAPEAQPHDLWEETIRTLNSGHKNLEIRCNLKQLPSDWL